MKKRILSSVSLFVLLLVGFGEHVSIVSAHNAPFPGIYDPTTLRVDTIAEPESLDPAWAYDTASTEVIGNVYESLIMFDRVYTDGPYDAGKTSQFAPKLASALPTIEYFSPPIFNPRSGLPIFSRFTFPIRTGVTFHSGDLLTPADVEYSFERIMVQDRTGGPSWLLLEPLLGAYASQPPETYPNWGLYIAGAVELGTLNSVIFNLAVQYPDEAFMQILSQPWASIVEQDWAVAEGDFNLDEVPDGWLNWEYIYYKWWNPPQSFLEDAINSLQKDGGTGPYKYDWWTQTVGISIARNPSYWDGWPAKVGSGITRLPGYLERVTWNVVDSWASKLARFLSGEVDMTYVPRRYRDMVLGQSVGGELIRGYWRQPPNEVSLMGLDALFFTFDINTLEGTNPYAPSWLPYGTFSTAGIPPDIFSDINVRRGFAYAFDYDSYIATTYLNEAQQPSDPVVEGLSYDNPVQQRQSFGLTLANYYLSLAWGGALSSNGMSFTITYNRGNVARQSAAEYLANSINSLNPLFNIQVQGVEWSNYLSAMTYSELPLFINGWTADFTDPHNFVQPFMHSSGTLAWGQYYYNPVIDALVEAGIMTPDDTTPYDGSLDNSNGLANLDNLPPESWQTWTPSSSYYIANPLDLDYPRRSIYYALQEIYFEEVLSVPIAQVYMRHWEQAWVRGWYYNPLYGGSLTPSMESTAPTTPTIYAYHLWKAQTHFGDANNNGLVDIGDVGVISGHWTGPPTGVLGYSPRADLSGGSGATVGSLSGPVIGMPDGVIDIIDVSIVSTYFDGPPKGPMHP